MNTSQKLPNDYKNDVLLTPSQTAIQLAGEEEPLSLQTLAKWRWLKINLPYHKVGRLVRYKQSEVDEYKRVRELRPTR